LAEGGIAKTLQTSAQLGTVRFNEPLAARSCGGNSASIVCRIIHGFKNLPQPASFQNDEVTHFPADATS
jgi:hypothetical protein